jgi:neutral ceramidase
MLPPQSTPSIGLIRWSAGACVALALCLLIPASASAQTPAAPRLRAGAAKVDISPDPRTFAVATDTLRDRLYVRAIYVEEGRTSAALVTVDAGGLGDDVVNPAIAASSAATGIPAANYIISATHTHSGGSGAQNSRIITEAIVAAVNTAKAQAAPARTGYGTAQLDLNVNRDLFNDRQEWRQGPNPAGASDKTLAVVAFVGDDGVPIGVYMNYGMHPINFYLSGVVSADFPGEATKFVEELYDGKTVALFSQGTSGDQNPRLGYAPPYSTNSFRNGRGPAPLTVAPPRTAPVAAAATATANFNPAAAAAERPPVPAEHREAYQKAIKRVGDYVTMLGHMIGSTAERVMREDIRYTDTAAIWAGQQTFTVPGRIRNDVANPARENVFPGYGDGPDVTIKVGVLRLGDIHFVTVNGEIYTNIGLGIKKASPASKTLVVTLANGRANSGYIYSDDAYSHLTFQVIGSRLKPGHAEKGIISAAVDLLNRSAQR